MSSGHLSSRWGGGLIWFTLLDQWFHFAGSVVVLEKHEPRNSHLCWDRTSMHAPVGETDEAIMWHLISRDAKKNLWNKGHHEEPTANTLTRAKKILKTTSTILVCVYDF